MASAAASAGAPAAEECQGPGDLGGVTPVLTNEELSDLLRILQAPDDPLDAMTGNFQQRFTRAAQFRAGCAMCVLLQENQLLRRQRVGALWLLCDVYRSEMQSKSSINPFLPVFLNCVDATADGYMHSLPAERWFAAHLLHSNSREIAAKTARQVLEQGAAADLGSLPDLNEIRRAYERRIRQRIGRLVPPLRALEIRPVLPAPTGLDAARQAEAALEGGCTADTGLEADQAGGGDPFRPPGSPLAPQDVLAHALQRAAEPTVPPTAPAAPGMARDAGRAPAFSRPLGPVGDAEAWVSSASALGSAQAAAAAAAAAVAADASGSGPLSSGVTLPGFRPTFARPAPPLLAFAEDEMAWLGSTSGAPALLWDASLGVDRRQTRRTSDLLASACNRALPPAEVEQLQRALDEDPQVLFEDGLSPQRLPGLVEHNSNLAISCLKRLMSSNQVSAYLSALLTMDVTLQSMEVVNHLTTEAKVPKDFLHMYISNCMQACDTNQDRYLQNRLVRLVCVFLQSLLRHRIIEVDEVLYEVHAFCIQFWRIKEASALFKMVQSLERTKGNAPGGGAGQGGKPDPPAKD